MKPFFRPVVIAAAFSAGLIDRKCAISARELAAEFSWENLRRDSIYLDGEALFVN